MILFCQLLQKLKRTVCALKCRFSLQIRAQRNCHLTALPQHYRNKFQFSVCKSCKGVNPYASVPEKFNLLNPCKHLLKNIVFIGISTRLHTLIFLKNQTEISDFAVQIWIACFQCAK